MAIRWDEVEGANFGPYLHSIEDVAERLEVLYRECYDDIRRMCERELAEAGNFSDADDAAQETLMKLAASVCKSYKPEMPFRPWLRQVAINVCKDFGRVRQRTDRTTERCVERGYGVGLRTPTPEAEGPEESVIRNMWKDTVVQSLLALPESERRALYRQVYEGLSYEEIGALEGHSHSSVRSHIFRAKERVKRHLAAIGGIEELGVPGVVGAAVAAMRRFRARSRAWMLRNVGTLGLDGGASGSIALSRAAEVVATAAVAVGVLFLPNGGPAAQTPSPLPIPASADALAIQPASYTTGGDGSTAGRAGDVAGSSTPTPVEQVSSISGDDPSVVAVPGGVLPPAPTREGDGYEREGDQANNDFRWTVYLPTGPFEVFNDGGFDCAADVVYETTCDTLDRAPDL